MKTAFSGLALWVLIPMAAGCSLPSRLDSDGAGFDYRPLDASGDAAGAGAGEARAAVHTELIQTMLTQRQYYAALAHIEQMARDRGASAELRYLEAEVRRKLGQTREAEALYQSLLRNAEYSGQAYHGLGLAAASKNNLRAAVQHLRTAAGRRPTDAEIRNDLGYALMLAGRYQEALPEIATAVELDAQDGRGRNNLLMLLMLKGDEAGVKRVAAESDVSPAELARLRTQAQSLKKRPAVIQEKSR